MKKRLYMSLLVVILGPWLRSTLLAQDRYDYAISFDLAAQLSNGTWTNPNIVEEVTTSGGDGTSWEYYPASDRYIMWFYSGPFNASQQAQLGIFLFVATAQASSSSGFNVSIGWTTPNWQDSLAPPSPADMSTLAEEAFYMETQTVVDFSNLLLGSSSTYEVSRNATIEDYNPEWICVCASGRNVWMWRYLLHESGPQNNNTPVDPPQTSWDYGDAPTSYGVLETDNGARHALGSPLILGAHISEEGDGQPSPSADADSYDDGVSFVTALEPGQVGTVSVTSTGIGILNAWLDLNADGDWDDTQEQILVNEPVHAGQNDLSFDLPASAQAGPTFARFRLSRTSGLTAYGSAPDGEVEDYAVTISAATSTGDLTGPVNPQHAITAAWSQTGLWMSPNDPLFYGWGLKSQWNNGPLVVDDWIHSGADPIVGLRWWGAFEGWTAEAMPTDAPTAFHFGIWTQHESQAVPDTLIWEATSPNWTWNRAGTILDAITLQNQQTAFEFTCFLSQDQWFGLAVTDETHYWLSIAAVYEGPVPSPTVWTWLTRQYQDLQPAQRISDLHATDSSQSVPFPPFLSVGASGTQPIEDSTYKPWEMAFELFTRKP